MKKQYPILERELQKIASVLSNPSTWNYGDRGTVYVHKPENWIEAERLHHTAMNYYEGWGFNAFFGAVFFIAAIILLQGILT